VDLGAPASHPDQDFQAVLVVQVYQGGQHHPKSITSTIFKLPSVFQDKSNNITITEYSINFETILTYISKLG